MENFSYRWQFGLMFGAAIGLAYGLVSQLINHLFLPGIPFYHPPFGAFGNVLLSVMLGAALGLASAWPETGFTGVLWSSFLGSLTICVPALFTGRTDAAFLVNKITALLIVFIPTAAMLSPVLILFRWLVNREMDLRFDPPQWQRAGYPIALVLVSGALGLFSLYSQQGRMVTPRMHALIQDGMQASKVDDLPVSLRPNDVKAFLQEGHGEYELEWDIDPTNKYGIPRPATSQFDQSIVIAHFKNGWMLACLYPTPQSEIPECRDYE